MFKTPISHCVGGHQICPLPRNCTRKTPGKHDTKGMLVRDKNVRQLNASTESNRYEDQTQLSPGVSRRPVKIYGRGHRQRRSDENESGITSVQAFVSMSENVHRSPTCQRLMSPTWTEFIGYDALCPAWCLQAILRVDHVVMEVQAG